MNRHQFELSAKKFRAGKISLTEFGDSVYGPAEHNSAPDSSRLLPRLPERKNDAHKGDCGKTLIVGGSPGMAGAAGLAASAALRSGSGLVSVATFVEVQNIVAAFHPCIMTLALTDDHGTLNLAESQFDAIGIGPGIGTSSTSIRASLEIFENATCPVVVDADAINCLSIDRPDLGCHQGPRILTPHPGEFRRLCPDVSQRRDEQIDAAHQLARSNNLIVILKGSETIVTDGERKYANSTGNPGMATAGSGDVLTGIATAFAGQGMEAFECAVLAVYLHGLAGDMASKKTGVHGLTAIDIVNFLPDAFQKHEVSV